MAGNPGLERARRRVDHRIREATADDIQPIRRCLLEAFRPYRAGYTSAAFADTVPDSAGLEQRMSHMTLLVAEDHGRALIGTIAYTRNAAGVGFLRGMAVRNRARGTGAAQALLAEALRRLSAAGCSSVTLETTLPLAAAIRFYEKNGFERTGRVRDFHGMPLAEYARRL